MIELKPCPFCGDDADYRYENFGAKVWVQCLSCGVRTSSYDADEKMGALDGRQWAAKAWNRRINRR